MALSVKKFGVLKVPFANNLRCLTVWVQTCRNIIRTTLRDIDALMLFGISD